MGGERSSKELAAGSRAVAHAAPLLMPRETNIFEQNAAPLLSAVASNTPSPRISSENEKFKGRGRNSKVRQGENHSSVPVRLPSSFSMERRKEESNLSLSFSTRCYRSRRHAVSKSFSAPLAKPGGI